MAGNGNGNSVMQTLDAYFQALKTKNTTASGKLVDQFSACLKNQDMIAKLNQIKDRGRKLGVIGTPNYFVNGKLVKSIIGLDDIRAAVAVAEAAPVATKGPSGFLRRQSPSANTQASTPRRANRSNTACATVSGRQ